MCEVSRAYAQVDKFLGARRSYVLFRSIKPGVGCIVFETDDTYIKWFPNGEIVEQNKENQRKE